MVYLNSLLQEVRRATTKKRGISLMVKRQFSKLRLGVRFSHPAPKKRQKALFVRDERVNCFTRAENRKPEYVALRQRGGVAST